MWPPVSIGEVLYLPTATADISFKQSAMRVHAARGPLREVSIISIMMRPRHSKLRLLCVFDTHIAMGGEGEGFHASSSALLRICSSHAHPHSAE